MKTMLRVLAVLVLVAVPALAQEPLVVKISCREGGAIALEPVQVDSLILRATGRTVQWELQTVNCPQTVHRVEVRFAQTSPFGETPADKELIVPELPSPLPESVPLISREITVAGEHRYEVLLLDAEGNVLGKSQGRISARAIAPGMALSSLLVAVFIVGAVFWVIRRRLVALSASR
jgi:hypothetical protein